MESIAEFVGEYAETFGLCFSEVLVSDGFGRRNSHDADLAGAQRRRILCHARDAEYRSRTELICGSDPDNL